MTDAPDFTPLKRRPFGRYKPRDVAISLALIICFLVGCDAAGSMQKPAISLDPTNTPTVQPTPTLDPALLSDILFHDASPDCEFPCWEGLRIGESSPTDVQHVMDTTFGFSGSLDFFSESRTALGLRSDLPGVFTTGNGWLNDDTTGTFSIRFYTEGDTLKGIHMLTHMPYTAQHLIQRVGQPDVVVAQAGFSGGGQPYLSYYLLYQEGIAFGYSWIVDDHYFGDGEVPPLRYCLNQQHPAAYYIIFEPLAVPSLQDATPLQLTLFPRYINDYKPIKEVVGRTEAELMQLAQSDDPCFEVILKND